MKLLLATRKSMLALAQARAYYRALEASHPGLEIEERQIVTTGDRIVDRPLYEVGGKGVFLKEIEEALLAGEAHLAVHSIKDVPAELAPGLVLAAVPEREDPRDAWLSRDGARFHELPAGAKVGTSSLRRVTMLRAQRPDLVFVPLRGNVDTRVAKVKRGELDAAVLACAGLNRLGRQAEITEVLAPELCLPAVGQGALGIECRDGDEQTWSVVRTSHHLPTAIAVATERGVMRAVSGSCQVPVAAYATREGDEVWLRAMLADADGANARFAELRAPWPADERAAAILGARLGATLAPV